MSVTRLYSNKTESEIKWDLKHINEEYEFAELTKKIKKGLSFGLKIRRDSTP